MRHLLIAATSLSLFAAQSAAGFAGRPAPRDGERA